MSNSVWFDSASLSVDEATGDTSVTVAGLQGIEVSGQVAIERLYTGDSIKIDSQQQHEFQVPVSVEYSLWADDFAKEWLGGEGSSASSLTDTSDPQKFNINALEFDDRTGQTYSLSVDNITFEEMPIFQGSRGEFISWDLDGVGEDISDFSQIA